MHQMSTSVDVGFMSLSGTSIFICYPFLDRASALVSLADVSLLQLQATMMITPIFHIRSTSGVSQIPPLTRCCASEN